MAELVSTLTNLATLCFVVTSMLLIGLGLTLFEITVPLRDTRLVIMALLANLVVVPAVALLIVRVTSLPADYEIGLVLLSVAAGAPFLPKLAEFAKTDVPVSVALMALLIVASVIYLPLALPLLLPGIQVNGASIAMSLLLAIVAPLGLGLLTKRWWTTGVPKLILVLTPISNISLVTLLVLLIGLHVGNILEMIGSGAVLAVVVFTVVATVAGFLLGGSRPETRHVLALGTGQRNMAACFIIGNANFADRPQVLVLLAAASVISMLLGMLTAALFAKQDGFRRSATGK